MDYIFATSQLTTQWLSLTYVFFCNIKIVSFEFEYHSWVILTVKATMDNLPRIFEMWTPCEQTIECHNCIICCWIFGILLKWFHFDSLDFYSQQFFIVEGSICRHGYRSPLAHGLLQSAVCWSETRALKENDSITDEHEKCKICNSPDTEKSATTHRTNVY